jgi:hypothetical protein
MESQDLRSLGRLSYSLFGNWNQALRTSEQTLRTIGLKDGLDEQAIEKAALAHLSRAESIQRESLELSNPFFRLSALNRFLLAANHLERWSYTKIARTLDIPVSAVPSLLWQARLHYVFDECNLSIPYPSAGATKSLHCPQFDPTDPWTARMLDEEMKPQERQFLQAHMMGCDSCRNALGRVRQLIHAIDERMPGRSCEDWVEDEIQAQSVRFSSSGMTYGQSTFRGSLLQWLRSPGTWLGLGLLFWAIVRW